LLLLCSRSVLTESQVERAGYLLAQKPDWQLLARTAQSHRVFPLLYINLVRHFQEAVPDHIAGELKTLYLKNSAFNLFLSYQLLHFLGLFEAQQIIAVPFKGPVLAEYLFGDINCRTFVDLDILIAKEDLEKSVLLLQSAGLRFDIDLNLEQYLKLVRGGYHVGLIKENMSFMVELHWEMTGRYLSRKIMLNDVQSRLRKVRFLEQEVISLGPADLLVYLCIHGSRHRWMHLDFISCVAALLMKEKELDWDLAYRVADGCGGRRMLLLGCYLVREVLGAELNSAIAGKIEEDPVVKGVGDKVVNMLFADIEANWAQMSYWQEIKYQWQTMDTVLDCLRLSMKPLFQTTHSDWEWLRLPAAMSWLYYLLRPVRLGVKYARKLVGRGKTV
jgi:hypothetical protein